MENGFSSPRTDAFPAGLRVLVVDDDPTWLKILEKMLKKCSYEVKTCGLAREALNLLRERKHGFDIVISDVNMPDMDGFKLLEHVGLEMDLPVIMMSVDGETSRVMKGVQHGACDYLLKPIRMKELRNIWQHVLRKKILELREFDSHDGFEGMLARNGPEQSDDGQFVRGENKRKDFDKHDEKEFGEASSMKKARVVWSVDLHQKFVKAVDHIGLNKVGPKKVLDLMNVPWLTRENVASHLQKYRLYLSRLEKQNDGKTSNDLTTILNEAQNLNHGLAGNSFFPGDPAPELERAGSSSPTDPNTTWKRKSSHSLDLVDSELNLKSDLINIPSNSQSHFQLDQFQSISSYELDDELQVCWVEDGWCVKNYGQNIEVRDYIGYEYWYDPTDYNVIDDIDDPALRK